MASQRMRGSVPEFIARIRKAFLVGINSVQPHELIRCHLQRSSKKLTVNQVSYELRKNVYVVGFGKAVIGMIRPLEEVLRDPDGSGHIREGIVSVPLGIQETFSSKPHILPDKSSLIELLEGAKDNIPDQAAHTAAKKIVSLVKKLKKEDLLIVLISGGGSALLPYPAPPLTLEEKSKLVKVLSQKGATITELNTVRKALSLTKGGRLANVTEAQTLTLILSDIIDSPLDMIASGPTVVNRDPADAALHVLNKYEISLSEHVKEVLNKRLEEGQKEFQHVNNCIIGSNETALLSVQSSVTDLMGRECKSLILSSSLSGDAATVGRTMADFSTKILGGLGREMDPLEVQSLLKELCVSEEKISSLTELLDQCRVEKCPLVLIFGGETTVHVRGSGKGGRNQEMVLSFSLMLEEHLKNSECGNGEIVFLSGGTDGIDGPTDAAGALTYGVFSQACTKCQVQEAREYGLNPEDFLKNNDSYSYFTELSAGEYLLKPGHTGTNVMDLQILFINPYY